MARVVQKSVRGVPYVQVVEDYKDATGVWRQKVLQSFGAYDPGAFLQAQGYAAQVNALKAQATHTSPREWEDWEKAAVGIIGAVALGWLIGQVFKQK